MKIKELKLGVTNCYLVETGDRYVLIDTGYANEWELFCRRLKEVNVTLADVSHLVLTHHHDDHCGLLNSVLRVNEKIQIVLSYRAKDYLAKGENDRTHGAACANRRANLFVSFLKWRNGEQWTTHPFPAYEAREADILVLGETRLEEIGIPLNGRIVETPGHSSDSISVLLEDGTCFVGDAASNLPQFLGLKYCVIIVEDIEEYYKTWRRLLAGGAQRVFPAHGGPFPAAKLAQNVGSLTSSDLVPLA